MPKKRNKPPKKEKNPRWWVRWKVCRPQGWSWGRSNLEFDDTENFWKSDDESYEDYDADDLADDLDEMDNDDDLDELDYEDDQSPR